MFIPLWVKFGMLGFAVALCLICVWIFISARRAKGVVMHDLDQEFTAMVAEISRGSDDTQPKRFTVKGESYLYYPEEYTAPGQTDVSEDFQRTLQASQTWLVPVKNEFGCVDRMKVVLGAKELTFLVDPTKRLSPTGQPYVIDMTSTSEEELQGYWKRALSHYGFDVTVPE
jgi:hypothetical protein